MSIWECFLLIFIFPREGRRNWGQVNTRIWGKAKYADPFLFVFLPAFQQEIACTDSVSRQTQ